MKIHSRLDHAAPTRVRRLKFERLEKRLALSADAANDIEHLLEGLDTEDRQLLIDFLAADRPSLPNPSPLTIPPVRSGGIPRFDPGTEVIRFRLDTGDAPPTLGETFFVDFYVSESASEAGFEPVATNYRGIFQAMFDLRFDSGIVQPLLDDIYLDERFLGRGPSIELTEGVLQDLGGFVDVVGHPNLDDLPLNDRGEFLLTSIPFRVIGVGDAAITPLPSESGESFLLFGSNVAISNDHVTLPRLDIAIAEPSPLTSPSSLTPEANDAFPQSAEHMQAPAQAFVTRPLPVMEFLTLALSRILMTDDAEMEAGIDGRRVTPPDLDNDSAVADVSIDETSPSTSTLRESGSEEGRFWRDYPLDLLDDEAGVSRFELQLRWLRLKLFQVQDAAADFSPESPVPSPSIIDGGMVDISLWLTDPIYRSWKPTAEKSLADRMPGDAFTEIATWQPRGKTASLERLETANEVGEEAAAIRADLFRRFAELSADAMTGVPSDRDAR